MGIAAWRRRMPASCAERVRPCAAPPIRCVVCRWIVLTRKLDFARQRSCSSRPVAYSDPGQRCGPRCPAARRPIDAVRRPPRHIGGPRYRAAGRPVAVCGVPDGVLWGAAAARRPALGGGGSVQPSPPKQFRERSSDNS